MPLVAFIQTFNPHDPVVDVSQVGIAKGPGSPLRSREEVLGISAAVVGEAASQCIHTCRTSHTHEVATWVCLEILYYAKRGTDADIRH